VTGNQNGRCGRIRGDDGSHDGRADSPWLSAWDDKSRTRAGTLHAVPNVKQRGQRQVSKVCCGAQTQFSSSLAVARRFDVVFVSLTKGWWSGGCRGRGTSGAPKSRQAPEIATQKAGPLIAAAGVAALALRIF
jgi:hypothetical protein